VLITGTQIANSFTDLTTQELEAKLDDTEAGDQANSSVWTAVQPNGTADPDGVTCGNRFDADGRWTELNCNYSNALYCFLQR
jgi:hypothetical protein